MRQNLRAAKVLGEQIPACGAYVRPLLPPSVYKRRLETRPSWRQSFLPVGSSSRELGRQLRGDPRVVAEERQVGSHAFTASEGAQAVE